jgi:hypothetical protein
MIDSHGARFNEETLLAPMLSVWVGNPGFAGCSTVTTASWSNVAKRSSVGLSPWFAQTSGATNQNSVSTCAEAETKLSETHVKTTMALKMQQMKWFIFE